MGSFCAAGKQTTNTSQTQTYSANPVIAGAGTQAIGMAEGAASQPFQTPAAPVAPFNPFQQQSFSQIQGLQGGLNPFVNNASASEATAAAPITQADINQNMNPYASQTLDDLKKYVFDPQRVQTMGSATQAAGGVGADRLALTSQNLDKTQADSLGQAQAGFYGQALNAAQQSKVQAQNSAQGWLNLGLGNQTGQLQATGALAGAGNQQQAQTQAQLMSPYEQTLAQIAYPYQQAQFLAGITGGLSGAFGGTTSGQGTQTTQQAQPSWFNQIAGLGMAGLGAYGASGGFGAPTGAGASSGNPFSSYNVNNGYVPSINGGGVMPGYAEGGEVNEDMGVIPHMDLPNTSGQGQAHNNLNLAPAKTDSGSGSSGGLGDVAKMAAQIVPMFLARGGPINPWDSAKRYAQFKKIYKAGGGEVEEVSPEDYNFIDDKMNRPIEGTPPNLGMYPFNRGMADAQGNVSMYPDSPPEAPRSDPAGRVGKWLGLPNLGQSEGAAPSMATPAAAADMPPQAPKPNPWEVPANAGRLPAPGAYARPLPDAAAPPAPAPVAPKAPTERIAGYGPRHSGINSDMKISDFEMPKSQQPYPDSLDRDWGQTATRSPWMALVQAGAKMAQSTKSGAAGLAEGVEAGATHLDKQRSELRTEQQINQKAQELYRHAKSELLKYTRKTPHELAIEGHQAAALAQGRFQPINYTDPATGNIKVGNYDAKRGVLIDSTTRQPVDGGVRLLPRGAGVPMTEAQIEAAAKNRFVNEPGKYQSIDEAREAVKKQIQTTTGAQPGATADSAIPDPGDGNRVSGTWYINPATGKPDRWR